MAIHNAHFKRLNIESHIYLFICLFINLGDCIWSEWMDTACSKTCGQGTKTIRRFVRKPEEIVNGGNCDGSTEKIKQCDTRIPCKSYGKQFVIFPCIPYIENQF